MKRVNSVSWEKLTRPLRESAKKTGLKKSDMSITGGRLSVNRPIACSLRELPPVLEHIEFPPTPPLIQWWKGNVSRIVDKVRKKAKTGVIPT